MAEERPSAWRRVFANPRACIGGGVVLLLVVAALFAPVLAPHDPLEQDLINQYQQPFWSAGGDAVFPLGTDNLGRDILSRLIHGSRIALIVAFAAAISAGFIGTVLGLVAGYFGGAWDVAISRLVEIWMSFPAVLLAIVLVAVLGTGLHSVIIAIAVIDWTRFCRVVRAETMAQKQQDYVATAVTIGLGRGAVLLREILPNVAPLLLVLLTLEMGIAVIVEAILSFVGLSASSGAPTWGGLLQEGRLYVNQAPWLLVLPILCIVATVLAFNALGDGLKDALDPALRR